MLASCLSFSCTLNSPYISQDAFKGGWQKNGLNGVCWRNTYKICGHAIVGCSICKAYGFCWGCGSIKPCLLSSSPCYSDVEEERRRKVRGKRKELLITCFVWSESPCKYMNSKCRKSNLVAHRYILLFAYLPAPVVSSCISGLGISNTQRYAYIFFLYSTIVSHSFFYLAFLCVLLNPVHLFSSSICSPPLLTPHLTHPFPSVSLRHQGVFPPRQDAWQGSRWNGEQMTNLSLNPSFSFHLSHCPARGPPQPCFLPPSSTFPSYLTTLIFKSAQAAFHLLLPWRSRQTTKGERRWDNVPTLILYP